MTTPREHARFCYLALHKGNWAGKQLVPSVILRFRLDGHQDQSGLRRPVVGVSPAQGRPEGPGADGRAHNNHGYVVPSLDLVFVRLGDGNKFPKNWEQDLVKKVVAAVNK